MGRDSAAVAPTIRKGTNNNVGSTQVFFFIEKVISHFENYPGLMYFFSSTVMSHSVLSVEGRVADPDEPILSDPIKLSGSGSGFRIRP